MFDTMQVARKLREARIARNMTQVNLADAMEVSYQAVSNWERGNSMPDISKLSQLCEILGISIDELLGAQPAAGTIKKVLKNEENKEMREVEPVSLEELAEVAQLLPPKEVSSIVEENAKCFGEELPLSAILTLAPFLETELLDQLAERVGDADIQGLNGLAPFLSTETLDRLAEKISDVDIHALTSLAPFLSEGTLGKLAEAKLASGELQNPTGLAPLAPFLPKETLHKLAEYLLTNGDYQGLRNLAPFC